MQTCVKILKYNLHYKRKNYLEALALEAETAMPHLDITQQQYCRRIIAKTLTGSKQYKE
jgi:hypothetical protein